MNRTNRFSEELAAFYEASHDYGDIGDESFYLDAATDADGPVLEGACGSGRLYLELLRRGVDADGFDVSPAMLDILRERAAAEDLSDGVGGRPAVGRRRPVVRAGAGAVQLAL